MDSEGEDVYSALDAVECLADEPARTKIRKYFEAMVQDMQQEIDKLSSHTGEDDISAGKLGEAIQDILRIHEECSLYLEESRSIVLLGNNGLGKSFFINFLLLFFSKRYKAGQQQINRDNFLGLLEGAKDLSARLEERANSYCADSMDGNASDDDDDVDGGTEPDEQARTESDSEHEDAEQDVEDLEVS
jgi:ATPase subunit of ABC transporter with duplicated ATPase domains